MFRKVFNRPSDNLGGEIFQEKKRRERRIFIVLGIFAMILLNFILYFLSSR